MIFESREDVVLVNVKVGWFEGVTVSTVWRLVCDVEAEEVADEVRVELGEGRPMALRMRSLSGIAIDLIE